jgi:hypothetical protein
MPRHRPPLPCVLRCRRRISCRSACCQAPSSGLLQRSPLRRRTGWSPLPRARGLASVSRCHAAHMFRPRGFSPPRRLPPPDGHRLVASCCRPWGSPGFGLVGSDVPVAPWGLLTDATPSRAFPSTGSRACVTADRCPLAVGVLTHPPPRGLAPPGSPLPCLRVAARAGPMLSWASLVEVADLARCRSDLTASVGMTTSCVRLRRRDPKVEASSPNMASHRGTSR